MTKDVAGYLSEQQRKASGDVAQDWGTIEELYNKKLWHQLTLKLLEFVQNPMFSQGDGLVKLYNNFLSDFEHRINALSLVEISLFIVKQMKEPEEALEFLDKMKEKVKENTEASVLCMTTMGNIRLKQKDLEMTKKIIEEAEQMLEKLDGVTSVHSGFYEMSSNFHKIKGDHAKYYRDALRFLGCTDLSDLSSGDQVDRSFNLGLAAILGKGVYNFGELLAHPVLDVMKETEKQWLVDLLFAFNSGNIPKFEELKTHWQNQPDLASHEIPMRQKISLLCLMEMTFKRPATNRQLTFDEIATEAKLSSNEVELLVMKALSLGLVKGSIDQVEQKVHMTWVQPRVLNKEQISTIQTRLDQWCKDVRTMENMVENRAHDILT